MFQLKNMIYIHDIFRPTAKQSEPDYNTGTTKHGDEQKTLTLQFLIL